MRLRKLRSGVTILPLTPCEDADDICDFEDCPMRVSHRQVMTCSSCGYLVASTRRGVLDLMDDMEACELQDEWIEWMMTMEDPA